MTPFGFDMRSVGVPVIISARRSRCLDWATAGLGLRYRRVLGRSHACATAKRCLRDHGSAACAIAECLVRATRSYACAMA
jgi:hypothetical protein